MLLSASRPYLGLSPKWLLSRFPHPPQSRPTQDKAVYRLKGHKTKYSFIEPGRHLRGRELNLTLVWCVMPRVGE